MWVWNYVSLHIDGHIVERAQNSFVLSLVRIKLDILLQSCTTTHSMSRAHSRRLGPGQTVPEHKGVA